MMELLEIGHSGLKGSRLALGTWAMGGGTSWKGADDARSIRVIHQAGEAGINLIDTAPVYGAGHSEEVVGKAVKGRRGDYLISTKCTLQWREARGEKQYERDGHVVYRCFEPASLRRDLEDSLRRLGTDYIDIYLTHRQPSDPRLIEEMYGALQGFKQAGKIRAIGISNATPAILEAYLKFGPVDLVQEKYSILESGAAAEYIPLCGKHQVVFQAFSVLERGLLSGRIGMDYQLEPGEARGTIKWFVPEKRRRVLDMLEGWGDLCRKYGCSVANLVVAYTLGSDPKPCVLFGASRPESLQDTLRSTQIVLAAADKVRMAEDIARTLEACQAMEGSL